MRLQAKPKICIPLTLMFVVSCRDSVGYRQSKVDELHDKVPSSVVVDSTHADVKTLGTVKKEYQDLKVTDIELPVLPTVNCSQSSIAGVGAAATLVMTCNLILPNGGIASTDLWAGTYEWIFTHNAMAPVTVQVDNTVNGGATGRFTFSGAEPMRLLYIADTGRYMIKHTGARTGFVVDKAKLTITGETCRIPIGGLINVKQTGGYTVFAANQGGFINIVPPEQGGRFLVSNSTLQSNLTGSVIMGVNNSRINHLGTGGTVTIFDGTTYVTNSVQQAIYASPYASITPGPNTVTRFRSELGLCERE